jgi:hypothetical protein
VIRKCIIVAAGLAGVWATPASAVQITSGSGWSCSSSACANTYDTGLTSSGSLLGFGLDLFNAGSTVFTNAGISAAPAGMVDVLTGVTLTFSTNSSLGGSFSVLQTTTTNGGSFTGSIQGSVGFTLNDDLADALQTELAKLNGYGGKLALSYSTALSTPGGGVSTSVGPLTTTSAAPNPTITDLVSPFNGAVNSSLALRVGAQQNANYVDDGDTDQTTITQTDSFTIKRELIMGVEYDYTQEAIPEPFTAALLGTALVGLGFMRRRLR